MDARTTELFQCLNSGDGAGAAIALTEGADPWAVDAEGRAALAMAFLMGKSFLIEKWGERVQGQDLSAAPWGLPEHNPLRLIAAQTTFGAMDSLNLSRQLMQDGARLEAGDDYALLDSLNHTVSHQHLFWDMVTDLLEYHPRLANCAVLRGENRTHVNVRDGILQLASDGALLVYIRKDVQQIQMDWRENPLWLMRLPRWSPKSLDTVVECGLPIAARNDDGDTLLHAWMRDMIARSAAGTLKTTDCWGRKDYLEYFAERGIDLECPGKDGERLSALARRVPWANADFVEFLEGAIAASDLRVLGQDVSACAPRGGKLRL